MNNTVLGSLCIIGASIYLISGVYLSFINSTWMGLLCLVFGLTAGALGVVICEQDDGDE